MTMFWWPYSYFEKWRNIGEHPLHTVSLSSFDAPSFGGIFFTHFPEEFFLHFFFFHWICSSISEKNWIEEEIPPGRGWKKFPQIGSHLQESIFWFLFLLNRPETTVLSRTSGDNRLRYPPETNPETKVDARARFSARCGKKSIPKQTQLKVRSDSI